MNPFLVAIGFLWVYFTLVFIIASLHHNYGLVDIAWGSGFVLLTIFLTIYTYLDNQQFTWLNALLLSEVTLWGLRLSWHIGRRNIGKKEDFRYAEMRQKWAGKGSNLKAYVNVFMIQAFFMLVISSSLIVGSTSATLPTPLLGILGGTLFLVGFLVEAIADNQLKRFVQNPQNKGQLMTKGLWSWSRHPNYFGEAVLWWGIALPILFIPGQWFVVISPLTITWLVRFVSGVPLLEKKYANRRDFQDYAKRTSVFVLWPPKKG